MKVFNTTAICIPEKHYMVDLSEKVQEIKKLVDAGKYFAVNRARQYGKTTTLRALRKVLVHDNYVVVNLDFQGISRSGFETEEFFVQEFSRLIIKKQRILSGIPERILEVLNSYVNQDEAKVKLSELFVTLNDWCALSEKPVVMIIDEVDSATNNQVFLDFLSQLRDGYISRESEEIPTFQSVILAGVTDVKHLKGKIRPDSEHKENSPWNIAADFMIDMSLSEKGIQQMLDEYASDHHLKMNTGEIARQIRGYTNGYPFLVSRICQLLDEQMVPGSFDHLADAWTSNGVEVAVKMILSEDNSLFDSLMGILRTMPKLSRQLKEILFEGETIPHLPDNEEQKQLRMFGFIVNSHNTVAVANRIFEMRLYNFYIGESRFADEMRGNALDNKPAFIRNGELDVPLILDRFIETQKMIRKLDDETAEKKFIEEEGREKFLTYLSPIINGVGTFSVEEQTRDRRRMDVVIHYLGKRYIIELKIWHGASRNQDGERQIIGYMERFGLNVGYMLSFNFNKNKKPGVYPVRIGDKLLYEGIV